MSRVNWFISVSEEVKQEAREHLDHLNSLRAGSIWTDDFENGMRFVLCQLTGDWQQARAIVEAYTELRHIKYREINLREQMSRGFSEERGFQSKQRQGGENK